MTADAALQKKRLTAMLAIDAVCFVLAGVAIYGAVSLGLSWAKPVFILAIAAGVVAQIWFILGWMRATKGEGASS
jgi:ABC-type maltose transport system permease subunit